MSPRIKTPRSAPPRVAFVRLARCAEASAPGAAPVAFRILAAGENVTDKGPLVFTPESARLVMAAYQRRGNPLAGYYEHEDRLPLQQRGGAPMKGACSAPSSALAIRGPADAPECWAQDVAWTPEAKRQIETGERTQISPVAKYDEDTREVLEIINFSLCGEGATHHGTLLASREGRTGEAMDELIQKIVEALQAGDYETAETLVQQAESMDGGGDVAGVKMARMAIKAAKPPPAPPPAPPKAAPAAMAATRSYEQSADVVALSRELVASRAETVRAQGAADAALREAKVGRVEGIIAAARDCFDAVDEREHLAAADPERTRKHVASIVRKRAEGTLAASRPAAGSGATPPKDATGAKDETHGLSAMEIGIAAQNKVDLATYAAAKARHAANGAQKRGA